MNERTNLQKPNVITVRNQFDEKGNPTDASALRLTMANVGTANSAVDRLIMSQVSPAK